MVMGIPFLEYFIRCRYRTANPEQNLIIRTMFADELLTTAVYTL